MKTSMPIKLSCQSCGQELTQQEVKENKCCPKCGSWLKINRTITPDFKEKSSDKTAFVKMLYSNVKVNQGSSCLECDHCFQSNFKKPLEEQMRKHPDSGLSNFRGKPCFPPIGSEAKNQILFIGTNPRLRIGSNDERFYLHALKNEENFLQFSKNGIYDSYGASVFDDNHYDLHKRAMGKIGKELGEDSSVAEVFMCASKDSSVLYEGWKGMIDFSCANLYLVEYIAIVKPRVIVCIGNPASQWFLKTYNQVIKNKNLVAGSLIEDLNAEYSKVQLSRALVSKVIFTLHPNSHNQSRSYLHLRFLEKFKNIAIDN